MDGQERMRSSTGKQLTKRTERRKKKEERRIPKRGRELEGKINLGYR
jgi:hypothetical protein